MSVEVAKETETKNLNALDIAIKSAIVDTVLNDSNDIVDIVEKKIIEQLTSRFGSLPEKIITIKKGRSKSVITELTHEKFEDVLKCVEADIPVFLKGAAGTGKNYIVQMIAKALKYEFYFSNAITQEFKISGFIDASGHYNETEFYKAFKNGGIFFLDELDASIPEVLVMLNAAIENRYFDFPNGKMYAHKDFKVIAAGNTYGSGADLQYVGRYKLDEASLDRFAMINIGYDIRIEMLLCNNNKLLVNFVEKIRETIHSEGVAKIISYRSVKQIHVMESLNIPLETIMRYTIIKGMDIDSLKMIINHMSLYENKYFDAFKLAVDNYDE